MNLIMNDLFEQVDQLPKEVQAILNSFDDNTGNDYTELDRINNELAEYGYTFDYYLDAVPSNLRRI